MKFTYFNSGVVGEDSFILGIKVMVYIKLYVDVKSFSDSDEI